MKVKPVSGRSVPDPERGGLLGEHGREVEASSYWLRRLACGDVVRVEFEIESTNTSDQNQAEG